MSSKKKKKLAPGRVSKLTPEIQKAYCDELRTGCHMNTAADRVGVGDATIWKWIQRGAHETTGPYFEFRNAVAKAKANVVQGLLARAHQRVKSKKEGGEGADPLPLLAVIDKRYSPQVRVQVTAELESAIDRVTQEFQDEPEILERVLACLAEETGAIEAFGSAGRKTASDTVSGEGIRAAQAIAATANVSGD